MIRNHKIGALSIVLFILGMITAFIIVYSLAYGVAGGLALSVPNFIINHPYVYLFIASMLVALIFTAIVASLLYKSMKENRHRLLEFSAGIIIGAGGFLIGYGLYWACKKLFDKKDADIYSYIIAFSIIFVVVTLIFYLFAFTSYNSSTTPTTPY